MYCIKRTIIISTIIVLMTVLITSCANKNDSYESPINEVESNSESNIDKDGIINFTVLSKKTISIAKNRINEYHLDNRWELSEIDDILNSIKGTWKMDEYIGFIAPKVYFIDMFNNDVQKDFKDQMLENYDEEVKKAKNNIPNLSIAIKEYYVWDDVKETNSNYIYVNGDYPSPISVILSVNRDIEDQPAYKDQTTVSYDFVAEYPVIYIKFFIKGDEDKYEPATLVITTDNRFYILLDGAFYSLVHQEE